METGISIACTRDFLQSNSIADRIPNWNIDSTQYNFIHHQSTRIKVLRAWVFISCPHGIWSCGWLEFSRNYDWNAGGKISGNVWCAQHFATLTSNFFPNIRHSKRLKLPREQTSDWTGGLWRIGCELGDISTHHAVFLRNINHLFYMCKHLLYT